MSESTKALGSARDTAMTAIVQNRYGAPEQVLAPAEIARPVPGDDEVLVRMRATSVNTPDWLAVQGVPYLLRLQSGLRRPAAPVRGSDIAGVVAATGKNVTDLRIGDEVFGSQWGTKSRPGTFAEFALASADRLIAKPAELTFEEAGAAVMSGITALLAVRDVSRAGPGKRILINGASGGVGTFAIQIAKTLGAHVTGVCSTRNVEFVRSLGADEVVDYTRDDYTRGAQRYDAILDNVLNHSPAANAALLTPTGTFIPNSIGNAAGLFGGLPRIGRAHLMGLGSADVRSVTCVPDRGNLRDLAALLASGDVKVIIERTYPLAEAAAAITHMLGHRARGQIAVTIRPGGDSGGEID
ncbi:NAD(P)-dependent alcohol dehydrogenase [Nocardia sp. BMG111209]|uniref:NAD(P)-dependent alcohol dehydrogenase n=1 Tax=Nocardia sp. BMG111209 TaxID=1160137 RepID=UPI0003A034B4|nr:NAD(P)-dependent alcohol dehydrogenase [Nocardia sp. BMG111209]